MDASASRTTRSVRKSITTIRSEPLTVGDHIGCARMQPAGALHHPRNGLDEFTETAPVLHRRGVVARPSGQRQRRGHNDPIQ